MIYSRGDAIDALQAVWETESAVMVPTHPLHIDLTKRIDSEVAGGQGDNNSFDDTSFAGSDITSISISVYRDVISCITVGIER